VSEAARVDFMNHVRAIAPSHEEWSTIGRVRIDRSSLLLSTIAFAFRCNGFFQQPSLLV
jgi:hypothetical protein